LASLLNLSQTLKIGPSVGYFTVRVALDSQDDRYCSRSLTALAMIMSNKRLFRSLKNGVFVSLSNNFLDKEFSQ